MKYTLSIFHSVHKAYVATELEVDLDELANTLTTFSCIQDKEEGLMFNLAKFKTLEEGAEVGRKYHYIDGVKQETYTPITNTVRRCKSNIVSISALVLDVDDQYTLEDMVSIMDGVYCIFYSTFRNTWQHNKFRVVVPFSRPLLVEDIPGRENSIRNTFPGVDNASFTASQSFYFHSGPDPDNSISFVLPGELIDPYSFEEEVIETYKPSESTFTKPTNEYQSRVLEMLMSCSNVHYDSQVGSKNGGVLTLVSICRSIGLSYEQFDQICQHICDPSSQLTKQSVRRMAWTGWTGDKITKQKRDEFIKANNGIVRSTPKQYKIMKRVES